MTRRMSRERRTTEFEAAARKMYEALETWYAAHPDASLGEIEQETRRLRRELMGKTLEVLINGQDTGESAQPPKCPKCQESMELEGYRPWGVSGLEGEMTLERAYYVCPRCGGQTFFPPRPQAPPAGGPLE